VLATAVGVVVAGAAVVHDVEAGRREPPQLRRRPVAQPRALVRDVLPVQQLQGRQLRDDPRSVPGPIAAGVSKQHQVPQAGQRAQDVDRGRQVRELVLLQPALLERAARAERLHVAQPVVRGAERAELRHRIGAGERSQLVVRDVEGAQLVVPAQVFDA
jgi:hypothetical protein